MESMRFHRLAHMSSLPPTPSDAIGDKSAIPTQIASDWIEIAYLIIFFGIGGPVNLMAFAQQNQHCVMGEPSSEAPTRRVPPALHRLNRHLNYTDILVLFVYTPCRICWLLTYDWRGGNVMCKVLRYADMLCFQSSSVIIVCIALNRFFSIVKPASNAIKRVNIMLTTGWIYTLVVCLPQLFFFRTYEVFPGWPQCTDNWEISSHQAFLANVTVVEPAYTRRMHQINYQMTIFWIPVTLIALCYLFVGVWLMRNAYVPVHNHRSCIDSDTGIGKISVLVTDVDNANETSCTMENSETFGQSRALARRRAVQISLILVVTYLLCWLPHELLSLWDVLSPDRARHIRDEYLHFLKGLMVFNSVINPFLYGTMHECCP